MQNITKQNIWHFLNVCCFISTFFYTCFILRTSHTTIKYWFFQPNLPKSVFPVHNRTNEHYHRVHHIWNSLGTKFHHNQTILPFWTKFAQKRYCRSERENLNITIEFSIFELIWSPDFTLNNFDFLDQISRKTSIFRP